MMTADRRRGQIWNGTWRWNKATERFTNPALQGLWEEQVQTVTTEGLDYLRIHNDILHTDQTRRSWTWEGAYDGIARPMTWDDDGSLLTTIAFHMVTDAMGADAQEGPGGRFRGSEYFVISDRQIQVWGCATAKGTQYPYFEEWARID